MMFGNALWHCAYNLLLISMISLATFRYVVDVFLPRILRLLFREFLKWSANESKTHSLYGQSQQRRVLEVSPFASEGVGVDRGPF